MPQHRCSSRRITSSRSTICRRALRGLGAWLLVLDTDGVNVWCAAGKGTFSTEELCRRIESTGLGSVVSHRRLILPQLGASGVAAHTVAKATGFTVVFGPVRAEDIPAWLRAGRRKTPAMRTVQFGLVDRLILVPVEIANTRLPALALAAVAAGLATLHVRELNAALAASFAGYAVQMLGAIIVAGISVPALLPWLPTRSFATKGAVAGMAWIAAMALLAPPLSIHGFWAAFQGGWTLAGAPLLAGASAAFVASILREPRSSPLNPAPCWKRRGTPAHRCRRGQRSDSGNNRNTLNTAMRFRYFTSALALELDLARCVGCGRCVEVCPHDVLPSCVPHPVERPRLRPHPRRVCNRALSTAIAAWSAARAPSTAPPARFTRVPASVALRLSSTE